MGPSKELTPLMKQYWGVKTVHPDKIILFRMGDFFEMFHEDALTAAPILGIALTVRNKKSGDQTPMCGVPHHSIAGQINKLLEAGHKVALCDQVEDPKFAKGLVKREITRILSPGMLFDPDTLDSQTPNYLCAFDSESLAFMDSTTGECFYFLLTDEQRKKQLFENLNPVEVVYSDYQKDYFQKIKPETWSGVISLHEDLASPKSSSIGSCLRLLSYAQMMQGETVLSSLQKFEERDCDLKMHLSSKVLRHLEVFSTYKGEKTGSLFSAIDRTQTAGGGRRLKSWLLFPLTDLKKINQRQEQVSYWTQDIDQLRALRKQLYHVGDLERRLGKLSLPTTHPRDLKSLADSLDSALKLHPYFTRFPSGSPGLTSMTNLQNEIDRALVEEIPNQYREGAFIQKGYRADLDELIELATDTQKKVRELEEKEKALTGISSLKVRYNNVFGFYIEITNTHKNKVPTDRYQRKQTLANAERYITDELSELEKKVITAKSKRVELELEIFLDLKQKAMGQMSELLTLADEINHLDVVSSLAWLALESNYVRPQMISEGAFEIEGSRHPVIEQFLQTPFVANDVHISPQQCLLLTGPNMAGKSTIMRQVALISILAQVGSFVPARKATLPLIDQLFTRIGASDFLTEGLSTFMVEMQETAEMLHQATSRSLVILDEVGRGTSTYDGMSLAQSILEYFLRKLKSYTLFATHYHELTRLEGRYPGQLLNKHMSIHEQKGEIVFRYHLTDGPALKSYGIQVAQRAGLPPEVIRYAHQILSRLENGSSAQKNTPQMDLWEHQIKNAAPELESYKVGSENQLGFNKADPELNQTAEKREKLTNEQTQWLTTLKSLEIQKLTPLEALNKLAQWQQELS